VRLHRPKVRTPVHVVMPGVLSFRLCQPSLLLGKLTLAIGATHRHRAKGGRTRAPVSTRATNVTVQELHRKDITIGEAPDPIAVVCALGNLESATPLGAKTTAHLYRGPDREVRSR
jgi:hypothetical protein